MSAMRARMPSSGTRLIGIDENADCLAAAAARLGVASPQPRLRRIGGGGRDYDLETIPGRLPTGAPILLIQSDLLRHDDELDNALYGLGPFDAVTLWFSGTHAARPHDMEVQRQELQGDATLRQASELAAVECASNLVRSGGHLQIVVRGMTNHPPPSNPRVREVMQALSEQGSIGVVDIRFEPYDEPRSGDRIGVADPGTPVVSHRMV